MKEKFNNQFATQRLRETLNEVKFTIDDGDLYDYVIQNYGNNITIDKDYLVSDPETYEKIQDYAMSSGKADALNDYSEPSDYFQRRKKEADFEETSTTSGAGAYLPKATVKKKKIKKEVHDKENKLAAGEAENYAKDHWGWKEAPSIPNRPSKGGFIYKQLFEGEKGIDDTYESLVKILETLHGFSDRIEFSTREVNGYYNIVYYDPKQITKDSLEALRSHKFWNTEFAPSVAIFDNNLVNINFEKPGQEILNIKDFDNSNWMPEKLEQSVNENYSRFKKETKTRTNEQQFHTAMRLAEKKIHEANRILEYTAQLKSELSVIKENKNTQKLMEKITRGIAEAYGKMKQLK